MSEDEDLGELPDNLFEGMSGEDASRHVYGNLRLVDQSVRDSERNPIIREHMKKAEQTHRNQKHPLLMNRLGCLSIGLGVAAFWFLVGNYFTCNPKEEGLILNPEAEVSAPAEPLETRLLQPAIPVVYDDIAYIIDPGHGGVKGEKVGTEIKGFGIDERDYALDVGNKVAELLDAMGYKETQQTRTAIDPKLTLAKRRDLMDKDKKNVGVSLHINGCKDSSVRGVRVYYNNDESKKACQHVADALRPIFGKADVKPNYSWAVMKSKNPVVYVEMGFGGSNDNDASILMLQKTKIVNALALALDNYHSAK